MEYKELAKDAKVMAESFRQDGNVILPNKLEMHATAIEELLARAEKAERERDMAVEQMRVFVEKEKHIHIPVGTTSNGTIIERVIRKWEE